MWPSCIHVTETPIARELDTGKKYVLVLCSCFIFCSCLCFFRACFLYSVFLLFLFLICVLICSICSCFLYSFSFCFCLLYSCSLLLLFCVPVLSVLVFCSFSSCFLFSVFWLGLFLVCDPVISGFLLFCHSSLFSISVLVLYFPVCIFAKYMIICMICLFFVVAVFLCSYAMYLSNIFLLSVLVPYEFVLCSLCLVSFHIVKALGRFLVLLASVLVYNFVLNPVLICFLPLNSVLEFVVS